MEETVTPEPVKELSDLEKLKASNAAFEAELIKAREMRAEKQKLDAEALLGGESGGKVEATPEVKLTDVEYAEKFMKGEANPLGEDDISIN